MHTRTRQVPRSGSRGRKCILDTQGGSLLPIEVGWIVRTVFNRLDAIGVWSNQQKHNDCGVEQDGRHSEDGFWEGGDGGTVNRCIDTGLPTYNVALAPSTSSEGGKSKLTATTWATALIRPIAPKTRPTSDPFPIAINVPAPKLCNAGFPPLVNELSDVKRMKSGCEDVGVIETSRFAVASVKKEMEVTTRSKARERARKDGCEMSVDVREGAK